MYLIATRSFYYAPDCTSDLVSQIATTIMSSPTEAIKLFFTVTDSEDHLFCYF